eukprot:GFYU01004892.1.p2 GENE.GFYU01004892.1~~GFYU01004892.1.p2  ORF type:complete len:359 (-),score=124.82 GFYU01004892.1:102-1121(-)
MSNLEGILLGMGNPLLDISANVPASFLEKYDVKPNNAILAEEKHVPIYEDMCKQFDVEYIAGGATLNAIRVAQWMLQTPGATSYMGCIGNDKYGEQLRKSAEGDGVRFEPRVDDTTPTGTCAVLVQDKERSLIANLAAANNYKIDHLKSHLPIMEKADVVYSAGFFLTVSPDSMQFVGKHQCDNKKTYMMNLSAPFLCEFFKDQMMSVMPYVDVLFGNESEAEAFAKVHGFETTKMEEIVAKLAALPKENADRPRLVVITQGSEATCVSENGVVTSYPVEKMDATKIVDTNGAGDAFVGGFLAKYVQKKSVADCVNAGHYSAGLIIQVSGCKLEGTPSM